MQRKVLGVAWSSSGINENWCEIGIIIYTINQGLNGERNQIVHCTLVIGASCISQIKKKKRKT